MRPSLEHASQTFGIEGANGHSKSGSGVIKVKEHLLFFIMSPYYHTWINEVTFGKPPRMGLLAKWTNHKLRGLELSAQPLPTPTPGSRERLEAELITNSQWFNQWCLHNEACIKILTKVIPRSFGLVNISMSWDSGVSRTCSPKLVICISSIWLHPFIINW